MGGRESLPSGREETASWGCAHRLAESDTLWWWADPLFSEEGNDRWTTHIARAVGGELYEDLRRLTDGPGSFPLDVSKGTRRETPVLLGEAPPRPYVASFELSTDLGIGINRQSVLPLEVSGPGLTDLLVYDPPQGLEVDSLSHPLPLDILGE